MSPPLSGRCLPRAIGRLATDLKPIEGCFISATTASKPILRIPLLRVKRIILICRARPPSQTFLKTLPHFTSKREIFHHPVNRKAGLHFQERFARFYRAMQIPCIANAAARRK